MKVSIDVLPGRCAVEFEVSGSIVYAVARNIDTDATGPLVVVEPGVELRWCELDPDWTVAPSTG